MENEAGTAQKKYEFECPIMSWKIAFVRFSIPSEFHWTEKTRIFNRIFQVKWKKWSQKFWRQQFGRKYELDCREIVKINSISAAFSAYQKSYARNKIN